MFRRLSLVVLLCFSFLASSLSLRCRCNDQSVLSDCRWEEWTCTIVTSFGSCFTRIILQEDGSIAQDVGCVHRAWNPNFCGRISETGAILCCNDSDMCNQYLIPTFLQPTLFTKTEALQSISLIHPTPSVSDTVTIKAKVLSTFNPLLLRTTPERGSLSSALLTKTPSPTSEPEAKVFGDLKVTVPSLTVGQTVEVVYINPPTGALSINLVTASNDVALHFNPRYTSSGGHLVLNTLLNGVWQQEVYPSGYPFTANNVQTRVTVRITVRANDFLMQANGVDITSFTYRPGLSYDAVRHISWVAPQDAVLESIKVTY